MRNGWVNKKFGSFEDAAKCEYDIRSTNKHGLIRKKVKVKVQRWVESQSSHLHAWYHKHTDKEQTKI